MRPSRHTPRMSPGCLSHDASALPVLLRHAKATASGYNEKPTPSGRRASARRPTTTSSSRRTRALRGKPKYGAQSSMMHLRTGQGRREGGHGGPRSACSSGAISAGSSAASFLLSVARGDHSGPSSLSCVSLWGGRAGLTALGHHWARRAMYDAYKQRVRSRPACTATSAGLDGAHPGRRPGADLTA